MISPPAINGNGQLVSNGRVYKIALQLPLNIFIKFGALPFILFQQ